MPRSTLYNVPWRDCETHVLCIMEVYKPTLEYFKTIFPFFNIVGTDTNVSGDIKTETINELIDGITNEVTARLKHLSFEIPNAENKLPYLNLKNYICFRVADLLRFQFQGQSVVLNNVNEKVKELEEAFLKDLSKITNTIQNTESFPLTAKNLNP